MAVVDSGQFYSNQQQQQQHLNQSVFLFRSANYSVFNDTPTFHHHFSPPPLWMRCTICVMCVFVILFGGVSNLTTLAAFARNFGRQQQNGSSSKSRLRPVRRSLWQRQYVNILGLALVDAVICIYSCTVVLIENFMGGWMLPAWCCRAHWTITSWAFYGGIHMLMLVGYDRYAIVTHGVNYKRVETWRKIIIRTGLYGVVEPAVGTPFMYLHLFTNVSVLPDDDDDGRPAYACYPEAMQLGYWYPIILCAAFLLPVCSMAHLYFSVYHHTKQRDKKAREIAAKRLQSRNSATFASNAEYSATDSGGVGGSARHGRIKLKIFDPSSSSSRHDRASRILKFLFGSLIIFYTPYITVAVVWLFVMRGTLPNMSVEWWTHLFVLTQIVGLINNALNPLLYAYTMPKLHENMVNVWSDLKQWALPRVYNCD